MKSLFMALTAVVFSAGMVFEAEAKRLGGGGNFGAQRSATPAPKQATPPSQQQTAPAATAPAAAAKPAAAPAGNRWLGPLAGLAAGLGLGWLFAQGGFGGVIGTLLLALLAGVVIMMLLRVFARPRAQGATAAGPTGMQYSSLEPHGTDAPRPAPLAFGGSTPATSAPGVSVPADFDVESFLKHAKRNFLMLQKANDDADLGAIRDFTTDELHEQLLRSLNDRKGAQQTEVSGLEAELVEVTTEGAFHWAGVRFSGRISEQAGAAAESFQEIWNLRKPASGPGGWLLAGIQQVS